MAKTKIPAPPGLSFSGARRLAVLGIGSDLRGDDAAGIVAAETVRRSLSGRRRRLPVRVFIGGTAPENLTGEIKRYKPSHIVIIDSADFRKKPGSIFTFSADRVCEGVSFSTHKMPARILVDYLRNSFDCEVSIVCIQPKTIDFGRPISSAVNRAAKDAAKDILKAIDRGR